MRVRTPAALFTASALLALPTAACATTTGDPAGSINSVGHTTARAADAATSHVLAISIDGLNPAAIRQLGPKRAPNFYRLIDNGASTLNARTEVEKTNTLPNHTGMMTGRRVKASAGGHGVTWDDDRPSMTVQKAAGHAVASIFTVVHRAGESTALFSAKKKFGLYTRSWRNAIDRAVTVDDEASALNKALADLKTAKRAFTFLHLAQPDRAGHAYGFMSAKYVDAVKSTDTELGRVLGVLESTPALSDAVVILTADHGGARGAKQHSNPKLLADYTVPFLAWGPGIAQGDLYQLNPDYRDPDGRRPGYGAARQPVRNGDVANLAADLLGLGPVPGSIFDAEQDLDVLK